MATQHPQYATALPASGAFKGADVDEARRRRPATDLRDYAQARGLEFLDSRNPVGYWGVVPGDDRLQFNVLRGALPGARHGILFHHVRAVEVWWDERMSRWEARTGAPVHDLQVERGDGDVTLRDLMKGIPVAGLFVESGDRDQRPPAAGFPTTVAATLVPQVAALPAFQFVNHDNKARLLVISDDRIELDRYGLPGLWAEAPDGPPPDAGFVDHLMATPLADVLRSLASRPYLQVRIDHGQLAIGIDGYEHDPGVLDYLAGAVAAAASAIAEASRPMHRPQPFATPLPEASWPESQSLEQMTASPSLYPPEPYVPGMRAGAERRGWVPEDSVAYHLAFPDLPVPGTAFAVMRFAPAGTSGIGRLAWHAERPMYRYNIGRNAVLLPAAPGAAATPPGGVRRGDMNLNYAVADGIFSVWQGRDQDPLHTMSGMEALAAQALALGRAEGLGG